MTPSGLVPVTLAMCILNPAGVVFVDGSGMGAAIVLCVFAIIAIIVGYVVLWWPNTTAVRGFFTSPSSVRLPDPRCSPTDGS